MSDDQKGDSSSGAETSCSTLNKAGPDVPYLVVHAVDPVRPQQIDGLADEIRAAAVEHPETQIEMELVRGGFGVKSLKGAEATFRPEDDNTTVTSDAGNADFKFPNTKSNYILVKKKKKPPGAISDPPKKEIKITCII